MQVTYGMLVVKDVGLSNRYHGHKIANMLAVQYGLQLFSLLYFNHILIYFSIF